MGKVSRNFKALVTTARGLQLYHRTFSLGDTVADVKFARRA